MINRSKQAFTAGKHNEAKTLFDEALTYYGNVSPEEIYKAAVRLARVETEPKIFQNSVFTYLKILINKGWNKRTGC